MKTDTFLYLIKKNFAVLLVICIGEYALAQCPGSTTPTYRTQNGTGVWTTAGHWTIGPPPYTLSGSPAAYTIPAGHVVTIESSNFTLVSSLIVYGKLIINGKLNMAAGQYIDVKLGGTVCCADTPCNASERLSIGGTQIWSGSDGSQSGPKYSDGTNPLPITLLFLQGTWNELTVNLNWATAKEENFLKFEIERSSNGINNFYTIGEMGGFGQDTKERQDYIFTDVAPMVGKNFYRLKSIDNDGSFEYSYVVKVEADNYEGIVVFPNPVENQEVSVRTNFEPMPEDRIVIVDNLGLARLEYSPLSIESKISLPLGKGSYILRYITSDKTFTTRFVVSQ